MAAPRPALFSLCILLSACIDYGVHRSEVRDHFAQPARDGGVDMLWVLDDSATMTEEQEQLQLHTAAFTDLLAQLATVDFRLGVITTDMDKDEAGMLLGEVIDNDTPQLAEAFAEQVAAATGGSRDEQGFPAALAAADPEGSVQGFARDNAELEVVFFADEDDQSDTTPSQFLEALEDQRPASSVVVSTIVGDVPEGCFSMLAAADPGTRYIQVQEATGGARESICDADYDAMLERVALHVMGLQDRFYLSRVPSPETIEVNVDGALVTERPINGWRYDPGDNSLVFNGYAVPPPGAGIGVVYYEWMGLEDPDSGE